MQHLFNTIKPEYISQIKVHELFPHNNLAEDIRKETTFFNATPSFIRGHETAAPVTCKIIKRYLRELFSDDDYHHLIVNSYCHKLTHKGMYASIPGWHCDYSKQPEEAERTTLEEDESVRHWVLIIGTDTPPTYSFIDRHNISVDDAKFYNKTWPEVSCFIDRKIKSGWHIKPVKPFELLEFRGNELYRTMPSVGKCWRMQIKASLYPREHKFRPPGTQGKTREMQMVYMDCNKGWLNS